MNSAATGPSPARTSRRGGPSPPRRHRHQQEGRVDAPPRHALQRVFLNRESGSATKEGIMPSEHEKIESQKGIGRLQPILELQLEGVGRSLHSSLLVFGAVP